MLFSGRRIKAPEQGLIRLHPFVDVLEGRSLMTATAHAGVLAVDELIEPANPAPAISPWSQHPIAGPETAAIAEDPGTALARRTAPGVFQLSPVTSAAAFSEQTIGDTPWALFGNHLHDRRGNLDPQVLPTDEQIAAARDDLAELDEAEIFHTGRALTGAMMPFLTMSAEQANHPFA